MQGIALLLDVFLYGRIVTGPLYHKSSIFMPPTTISKLFHRAMPSNVYIPKFIYTTLLTLPYGY
jgi:hypothetical protein